MARTLLLAAAAALLAVPALAGDAPEFGDVAQALIWARTRAAAMPSSPAKAPPAPRLPDDPWRRVKSPSAGAARSIGRPDAGCLAGASTLPLSGPGFEVMRPSRRRFFGHPRLIAFLDALGRGASAAGLGTLLVGDLGQPRGGPTLSGHASHQTGLDVDVWYRQWPAGSPLSDSQRETLSSPSMVVPDFERLNASWNPNELEILHLAASDAAVERIFVNPVIKKAACAVHAGAPWLGKLRPWWGHDDHFHARLACDPQDTLCVSGADPIPAGDGCGAALDAWLSPASKAEAKRQRTETSKPPTMPVLPPECRQVLAAP
jgi:penicillin-insensitive murein endopeptidase